MCNHQKPCKNHCSKTYQKARSLDTLELSRDKLSKFPKLKDKTSKGDSSKLANRAKRKYMSDPLALSLVSYMEYLQEQTSDLSEYNYYQSYKRAYWRMWHCTRNLELNKGKLRGRYCKNRLCVVCSSIRTASLTQKYIPKIEEWIREGGVYFVTLTIPNMIASRLRESIEFMQKTVTKIQGCIKKRAQRAKEKPVEGLRKFEVTYNAKSDTFHPHYHIIIQGKENAESFVDQWLKHTKQVGSLEHCQDVKQANLGGGRELFKYFTKIVSSKKTSQGQQIRRIYTEAVHTIFESIKGVRTFQSFGFKLLKADAPKDNELYDFDLSIEESEQENYIWNQKLSDWFSTSTGENLSGYRASKGMKDIINCIVPHKQPV